MAENIFFDADISGERLLNQAMKAALDQESPELMIFQFFLEVGQFFHCDRIFVYEKNQSEIPYVVEWQNDNISSHKEFVENLMQEDLNLLYTLFERDNFVFVNDVDSIQELYPAAYELFTSQNIKRIFIHPLIVKNEQIGFYAFENFPDMDLIQIYDFLEMFGNFTISLLKFKNTFFALHSLSEHDSMTGLYNRGRGEQKIAQMVNNGMEGLFMMMDGNHFKHINDNFGHAVGDKVILALANALHKIFDNIGIAMRLGGDEFAVFVPTFTDEKDALFLMEDLVQEIDYIDIPQMNGEKVTASIGVAFKKLDDNINFEQLYKHADLSVYESKKSEGTPITFYKPEFSKDL